MTTLHSATTRAHIAISVVMSVYNGERHLSEAIDSILNQTFTDFEFIIVNDGSTDGTREILERYQDERIVLVNQDNTGVTRALNKGIALAQGKYIARQDADDVSKLERLQKQFDYMEAHPSVGLLGTRFEFIDEFGQVTRQGSLPVENRRLQERLKVINQFSHGSVLIRKEALDKVGVYREFFKYAQDYDLWLRIAEQYEVVNLPEYLFCYRELDQAISSNKILSQSLYAGIAADMARQRRETGSDTLQCGLVPKLPPIQALSKDLHQKLTTFYTQNPHEMLESLHDATSYKEMVFLFEQICAEKRQCQAELNNRHQIVNDIESRTRNVVTEQVGRQLEQMHAFFKELSEVASKRHAEDLRLKDEIIESKNQETSGLKQRVDDLNRQLQDAQEQMQQKWGDIASRDGLISQQKEEIVFAEGVRADQENQLKQKSLELADRDEQIRQIQEELARSKEVRTEQESQLKKYSDEFHDRENEMEAKRLQVANLTEELRLLNEKAAVEKLRVHEELAQKDKLLGEKVDLIKQMHADLQEQERLLVARNQELKVLTEKAADKKINFEAEMAQKDKLLGEKLDLIKQMHADLQEQERLLVAGNQELKMLSEKAADEKINFEAEMAQRDQIISQKTELLSQLDEQLKESVAEINGRDDRIRQLETAVAMAEQMIAEERRLTDEQLADTNQKLQDMEQQLRTKDLSLRELETESQVKSEGLKELEDRLTRSEEEKKAETLAYEQRISEKEKHIESLLKSKSWRLTAPLRALGSMGNKK